MKISRREFISVGVTAFAMTPIVLQSTLAQTNSGKTRLILLGTGGGPRPRTNSYSSSQVVLLNDEAYVIDCGDGVATQLVRES